MPKEISKSNAALLAATGGFLLGRESRSALATQLHESEVTRELQQTEIQVLSNQVSVRDAELTALEADLLVALETVETLGQLSWTSVAPANKLSRDTTVQAIRLAWGNQTEEGEILSEGYRADPADGVTYTPVNLDETARLATSNSVYVRRTAGYSTGGLIYSGDMWDPNCLNGMLGVLASGIAWRVGWYKTSFYYRTVGGPYINGMDEAVAMPDGMGILAFIAQHTGGLGYVITGPGGMGKATELPTLEGQEDFLWSKGEWYFEYTQEMADLGQPVILGLGAMVDPSWFQEDGLCKFLMDDIELIEVEGDPNAE